MSRPVICPLSVGATAPESLSVLQRRLQTAEHQAEELVRGLGSLGVSADQLLMNPSDGSPSTRPISPVNIHRALSVGATAPESLSVLQRRLQTAEQQAEELVRGLGSLGASADQLLLNPSDGSPSTRPISPVNIHRALSAAGEGLLWRQCETLVARVCRLESVLHALKLSTFRLETDRQLNPNHTGQFSVVHVNLNVNYASQQNEKLIFEICNTLHLTVLLN